MDAKILKTNACIRAMKSNPNFAIITCIPIFLLKIAHHAFPR